MLLSSYIEYLQNFMKEQGDMKVIYAKDEEGNDFHQTCAVPSLCYVNSWEDYYLQVVFDDDPDLDDEDYPHKAVCIN